MSTTSKNNSEIEGVVQQIFRKGNGHSSPITSIYIKNGSLINIMAKRRNIHIANMNQTLQEGDEVIFEFLIQSHPSAWKVRLKSNKPKKKKAQA